MAEIRCLSEISINQLYAAFNEAFSDYDRTWSRNEFEQLLKRRGYTPELSFGAFEDERLVSFTLNCIDTAGGKKTAYDTGTGTIKEHRGKGLSTLIFNTSILFIKQAGIQQFILEVLQHNEAAVSLYKNLGFTINRTFNYFITEKSKLAIPVTVNPKGIELKVIPMPEIYQIKYMWDFEPSWQNSLQSLSRTADELVIVGAFRNAALVGYGIIEIATGDIPQIAVARHYRRQYIGSAILNKLLEYSTTEAVKIINTDADDTATTDFLAYHGIQRTGGQYEMIMEL